MNWGALTSRILTATGWTWRELDETPFPAILDLTRYWRWHPPVHELVLQAWFEPEGTKGREPSDAELAQLFQMINPT